MWVTRASLNGKTTANSRRRTYSALMFHSAFDVQNARLSTGPFRYYCIHSHFRAGYMRVLPRSAAHSVSFMVAVPLGDSIRFLV